MRRTFDVPMSDVNRISRLVSNVGGSPNVEQLHFRWFTDDLDINLATGLAAEDTDLASGVLALNVNARLRIMISNKGTAERASGAIQLQARLRTASFTSEYFNVNSTSPCVRPSAGVPLDGAVCTRLLTQAQVNFVNGGYDEVDGAAATTVVAITTDIECEFCLKFLKGHLADGEIVDFRVIHGGTVLNAYVETPSVTISANTVVFTPDGVVSALHDWTKNGGGAGTNAEIDEGIPGDGDTSYITRLDNTPVESDTIVFTTSVSGSADVNSGADSWGVRSVAKKIGSGTPDGFNYTVYEGATDRAGPFAHNADVTTAYRLFVDTFDPSSFDPVTGPGDLRISLTGASDLSGDADPTVTVMDVVGQKMAGLDMLPLLGVS